MVRLGDEFRSAVTLMHEAVLDLPRQVDRWVLRLHQPIPLDENTPWCRTCKRAWPCAEFVEIDERLSSRT